VVTDLFLAFLAQHDDDAWLRAVDRLEPSMHEVDRAATRIWFHFFPLALERLMKRPDAAEIARRMQLAGRWRLSEQIDSSHAFLYGHQYWPDAKGAVLDYARNPGGPGSLDLAAQIQEAARRAARQRGVDAAVMVGITAVALRTMQQVGVAALEQSAGEVVGAGAWEGRTADAVVSRRRRGDSHGWFDFLRGGRRQSTVTFNERYPGAQFPLIHSQHLTTAAANDRRAYRAADPRCSEGPIPVQCRSCSCGTCWVGILSGSAYLSPPESSERSKLAEIGVTTNDANPVIRLACQAQASGPVSIVIPPWNGLLGRVLRGGD
jgi:ferredoxin